MTSVRLPRFQRSPSIAAMRLTERDREILRFIQRHRYLSSTQVASLVDSALQPVVRRLQLLYHHGYLDRPRCQIDYYHEGGSRSLIYCLGTRGVALLRREHDIPFARMEWNTKPFQVGRLFLEHALLVSDVMVALELACRKRPDVKLLDADELLATYTEPKRTLFKWRADLGRGHSCGVVPDRVFALEFSPANSKPQRIHFCLEADRSTMPVVRESLDQTSILRKLLAYEATWTQRTHQREFSWQRFRVLIVTTSAERLRSMQAASERLERGRGLFLFGTVDALQAADDLLDLEWDSHRPGHPETLLS